MAPTFTTHKRERERGEGWMGVWKERAHTRRTISGLHRPRVLDVAMEAGWGLSNWVLDVGEPSCVQSTSLPERGTVAGDFL